MSLGPKYHALLLASTFATLAVSLKLGLDSEGEISVAVDGAHQKAVNGSHKVNTSHGINPLRWLQKRAEDVLPWVREGSIAAPNIVKHLHGGMWFGVQGGGYQDSDRKWLFGFEESEDRLTGWAARFIGPNVYTYGFFIEKKRIPTGPHDEYGWEFDFVIKPQRWNVELSDVEWSVGSANMKYMKGREKRVTLRIYSLKPAGPKHLSRLFDVMFWVEDDDKEWGYLFDLRAWQHDPSTIEHHWKESAGIANLCRASKAVVGVLDADGQDLKTKLKSIMQLGPQLPIASEVPGWRENTISVRRVATGTAYEHRERVYAGGSVPAGPHTPHRDAVPSKSAMKKPGKRGEKLISMNVRPPRQNAEEPY